MIALADRLDMRTIAIGNTRRVARTTAVLLVKRIDRATWHLRIEGHTRARWGDAVQARADVDYFLENGCLPPAHPWGWS